MLLSVGLIRELKGRFIGHSPASCGEATLHSRRLLHKRSVFMRERALHLHQQKKQVIRPAFLLVHLRVPEEKTVDNCFFEEVTKTRRNEARLRRAHISTMF